MKKLAILLFLLIAIFSYSQSYYNGSTYGNSGIDSQFKGATDANGNLYTAGLFQSSVTFNTSTITSHGGNADGFLTKFDQNGNPIWIKGFGGANDDVTVDVAIDMNGNIYLTGYFQGAGVNAFDANPATDDDDGNPSTSNADEYWLSVLSAINSRDCFIIKLDSNGDFVWAKQVSNPVGAANEDSSSIEIDGSGNVYVAGNFLYADFDPSPSSEVLITASNTTSEGFLLKLDPDGNFVWVKTYESTGISKIMDMEFSPDGNLFLTGRYNGEIDLDSSSNVATFSSNGETDLFLLKLDTNGDYLWGKSFGSTGNENVNTIKVLPSGIYVCGHFSETTDFDPSSGNTSITPSGDDDGFLSKFDSSGNFDFVYTIGGDTTGNGFEEIENVIEKNGNLIISGDFIGTADFDNSSNSSLSTSAGLNDAFVLEINSSNGDYLDHNIIGGDDKESNNNLVLTNGNELLLYGNFRSSSIDLNPFDGIDIYNNNFAFEDFYISHFSTLTLLSTSDFYNDTVELYPNPTKDIIHISANNIVFNGYKIYNHLGQLVKNNTSPFTTININSLPDGIYYIYLMSNEKMIIKRIIKA